MKLAEIRAKMKSLMLETKKLIADYPDYNFPDEQMARSEAIVAEMAELKGKLEAAAKNQSLFAGLSQYNEYLTEPASTSIEFPGGKSDVIDDGTDPQSQSQPQRKAGGGERRKSVSETFLSDKAYQAWYKTAAPHGTFSKEVACTSPQVVIPGGIKALVTGTADDSAGAFVFNDVQRNLDQFISRRPLVMRDIITVGRTTSDTVEYVRQVSETNNAAMVPEATSTLPIGDGTGGTVTAAGGGLKPESAMVFQRVSTTVKTVAHWIPATKRSLADAGQMQTLIDAFLRYGLDEELEDQMVLGDGSGENFTGLTQINDLTAQAWDTNIIVTTRRAKTQVRLVGRSTPTAYLLNPADWETIQLSRTEDGGPNTGQFIFGGPAAQEVPTLWNLPVVESESVPVGTGYVGNFRTIVLWDREEAGVQVTDSHADFFVRNLVAILAEARAAFGCLKPSAIVEMDLTAA